MEDLKDSLEKFGWSSGVMEKRESVSLGEVGCMLRNCRWREVKRAWTMEAEVRSKLGMVKNLIEGRCRARCVQVVRKELRQVMAKLKGGTAKLRVETGKWIGFKASISTSRYGMQHSMHCNHHNH